MQFTQRVQPPWQLLRPVLVAIGVGLLLGFAGPFGSNPAYPRPTRYIFWLGLTVAGVICLLVAEAILPRRQGGSRVFRIGAAALITSVPMTFLVAWTITYLQPGRSFAPLQLPALFAAVAVIQALIAAVLFAVPYREPSSGIIEEAESQSQPPQPAPTCPAAIIAKLPRAIGQDIHVIETEDHYLRVHTSGGNALILMRMADAVALLEPAHGIQVHRRWWVADKAVLALETSGQRLALKLSNGKLVPVGRTFAPAVRGRFGSRLREQSTA